MIVTCASCQTRFRVAEDKIGPKGARIRCGRCQNVFVVKPPPPAEVGPSVPAAETSTSATRGAWPERPAAPPKASSFMPALEVAEDDPFAPRRTAKPPPDPFLQAKGPPGGAPPLDPFAALQIPSSQPAPETTGSSSLWDPFNVEDRGAPAPSERLPFGPEPALAPARRGREPAQRPELAPPPESFTGPIERSEFGVALEEGEAPPLTSLSDLIGPPTLPPPGAISPAEAKGPTPEAPPIPGPLAERSPPAESSTALIEPPKAVPAAPSDAAPPSAAPSVAPAPGPAPDVPIPPTQRAKTAAALTNALSLALLIAVAAALSMAWRGGLGPRLRMLFGRPAPVAWVEATHLKGGPYETQDGSVVLLVRGEVVARGSVSSPVRVRVDLMVHGQVAATAEALAGAMPNAEEVHGASGPEAMAALRRALDARAPRALPAGARLPFAVLFPPGLPPLSRLELHVSAEPLSAGGP